MWCLHDYVIVYTSDAPPTFNTCVHAYMKMAHWACVSTAECLNLCPGACLATYNQTGRAVNHIHHAVHKVGIHLEQSERKHCKSCRRSSRLHNVQGIINLDQLPPTRQREDAMERSTVNFSTVRMIDGRRHLEVSMLRQIRHRWR